MSALPESPHPCVGKWTSWRGEVAVVTGNPIDDPKLVISAADGIIGAIVIANFELIVGEIYRRIGLQLLDSADKDPQQSAAPSDSEMLPRIERDGIKGRTI